MGGGRREVDPLADWLLLLLFGRNAGWAGWAGWASRRT